MNDLYFERKYKFWFCQISHREVIIRSTKNEDDMLCKNIDIYIGYVDYLELPCQFYGFKIKETTKEDVDYISLKLGKSVSKKRIIVLILENKKYYIVASVFEILENDLNEDELPINYRLTKRVELDDSAQKIDEKEINSYNRNYKFWSYYVFHQEAIIRSLRWESGNGHNTIDLHLTNIKYLEIPWIFDDLRIEETNIKDLKYIGQKLDKKIPKEEIIVLTSKNIRYYIVANSIEIIKSKLEYYQNFILSTFGNTPEQ